MEKKISMFTPTREDPKATESKIYTPTLGHNQKALYSIIKSPHIPIFTLF